MWLVFNDIYIFEKILKILIFNKTKTYYNMKSTIDWFSHKTKTRLKYFMIGS